MGTFLEQEIGAFVTRRKRIILLCRAGWYLKCDNAVWKSKCLLGAIYVVRVLCREL